jgi:ABC-type multidrug transport system ATPase subunit
MSLLALEKVGKTYGSGANLRLALREVSFTIDAGELVGVWGRRRSGRSTLLRVAAGIERPDEGHVLVEGTDLYARKSHGPDAIGYCRASFRAAEGALVLDLMMLGQLSRGVRASAARERAVQTLRKVGVERCAGLRPSDLDGAERVRVAIARALVRQPKLLVIDEPTIGVDLSARDEILKLLRSLANEGLAVLASATDTSGLVNFDQGLMLSDGELTGSASADTASVIPLFRASGE